jgi:pimeloyl-ACP methyl ester carboxylesterase
LLPFFIVTKKFPVKIGKNLYFALQFKNMNWIAFHGKKVAYYDQGTGATLVLLHGLCEDSTIWNEFIKELPQFRIIRVDLSGFGESELLPEPSIDLMAQSVKAVLNELGVTESVLIGHSLGGYVSVAFAKRYPDGIKGLGLFHSHPYADSEDKKKERRKSIQFIQKNGSILYVKQLIPGLFAELFATSNEFLINSLIFKASKYPPAAIISAHEAMLHRPDQAQVLRDAPYPVLFIIGKQDKVIPYQVSLNQTHLPAIADIHILPKVAHMGMFRAKEETLKIVRNFMQRTY